MSRRLPALTLAVAALLLGGAAPASANPAARRFAAALVRAHAAMVALRPQLQAAQDSVVAAPQCAQAVNEAPDTKVYGVEFLLLLAAARGELVVAEPQFQALSRELDRIHTRDRVLRSGRAALRREIALGAAVTPLPADFCAQMDAWRQGGYADSAVPDPLDAGMRRLNKLGDRFDRRISRAARRLRRLGVPARRAALLVPDRLMKDALPPDPQFSR